MINQTVSIIFWLSVICAACFGQTLFQGLTPGTSTRSDAARVLGQPVRDVSETMSEYTGSQNIDKIYVQYRKETPTIERIQVLFHKPVDRPSVASLLGLPQQPDTTKWDSNGRLEEYFGSGKLIVLTHDGGEAGSPVSRVGYYSRELFEVALAKPQGQPQTNPGGGNRAGGPSTIPSQPAAQSNAQQLLVPEGTEFIAVTTEKISSKSAVLGDRVVLKVDDQVVVKGRVVINKGTTVRGSIVSAEKSGRVGKGGKLAIRIESTNAVDGQEIKLRATKGKEGGSATVSTVALTMLFGPLGLLKKGGEAMIKEGTKMKVYTDEEKRVLVKE